MNPDPNIPTVRRELAIVCSVAARPRSSNAPRVAATSAASNVAKSNRCPSTKTLLAMSPPPPTNGLLWQPEQELVSGPEMRLKFRGKTSGNLVLVRNQVEGVSRWRESQAVPAACCRE